MKRLSFMFRSRRANSPAGLPHALWALMLGNLIIGTGVMVVPGTLNDISSSLGVTVPQAGMLITAGAILMGLGAPTLATLVAGWLKLPFWPCVAYMAVGKLARYITMTAGLLWVFPGVFAP